jgi:hypothetical protein
MRLPRALHRALLLILVLIRMRVRRREEFQIRRIFLSPF